MTDIILSKQYVEIMGIKLEREIFIRTTLKKVTEVGAKLSDGDLDWAIKMEEAFDSQKDLSDKQILVLFNIFQRSATHMKYKRKRGEN